MLPLRDIAHETVGAEHFIIFMRARRTVVHPDPGPVLASNAVLLIEGHFFFKQRHILLADPPEIFGMNLVQPKMCPACIELPIGETQQRRYFGADIPCPAVDV